MSNTGVISVMVELDITKKLLARTSEHAGALADQLAAATARADGLQIGLAMVSILERDWRIKCEEETTRADDLLQRFLVLEGKYDGLKREYDWLTQRDDTNHE